MMRVMLGLMMTALLTTALAAPGLAADPNTLMVEDWSKQPEGKMGIPDGWKAQSWGSPKYDFRIVTQGGRKVLHLIEHTTEQPAAAAIHALGRL